jgi:hypothetical protein
MSAQAEEEKVLEEVDSCSRSALKTVSNTADGAVTPNGVCVCVCVCYVSSIYQRFVSFPSEVKTS